MERIFLSYTYRPHPDYAALTESLQRYARRVIEAMGMRVLDGVDLGGRALENEIKRRIDESDAVIALVTPQADDAGNVDHPQYVLSEFQHADARGKRTLRLLEKSLEARGLGAGHEYVPVASGGELDVILKVMNTIAVWKRESGRSAKLRLEPRTLGSRFDVSVGDRCQYIVLRGAQAQPEPARDTHIWADPGAAYVQIPNLTPEDLVRLRVSVGGKRWDSDYVYPFMGTLTLEERP